MPKKRNEKEYLPFKLKIKEYLQSLFNNISIRIVINRNSLSLY